MGCATSNSTSEKNPLRTLRTETTIIKKPDKTDKEYRTSGKTFSYKGVTILENVQKYMPINITREEIKQMIYDALEINDAKYKSKGKITEEQIEGLIDAITIITSSDVKKNIDDNRLNELNVIIGFYEPNEENIKKIFFKDQKPTEEEIEDKLNDTISMNEDAKLFAIEVKN